MLRSSSLQGLLGCLPGRVEMDCSAPTKLLPGPAAAPPRAAGQLTSEHRPGGYTTRVSPCAAPLAASPPSPSRRSVRPGPTGEWYSAPPGGRLDLELRPPAHGLRLQRYSPSVPTRLWRVRVTAAPGPDKPVPAEHAANQQKDDDSGTKSVRHPKVSETGSLFRGIPG